MAVKNFSDPDITLDLAVDQINVDRYLPPSSPDAKGKNRHPNL